MNYLFRKNKVSICLFSSHVKKISKMFSMFHWCHVRQSMNDQTNIIETNVGNRQKRKSFYTFIRNVLLLYVASCLEQFWRVSYTLWGVYWIIYISCSCSRQQCLVKNKSYVDITYKTSCLINWEMVTSGYILESNVLHWALWKTFYYEYLINWSSTLQFWILLRKSVVL